MQLDLRSTGRRKRKLFRGWRERDYSRETEDVHRNDTKLSHQPVNSCLKVSRWQRKKSFETKQICCRIRQCVSWRIYVQKFRKRIRPKITTGWLAHTYPPSFLNGWWILLHCSSSQRRWPRTNSQGSSRRSIRSWMNWSMPWCRQEWPTGRQRKKSSGC